MRRGTAFNVLVGAITLVLVIVIVVSIARVIKNHYDGIQEDLPCAAQVLAHSVAVQKSGELSAPVVSCPTKRVTIDSDADALDRQKIVADQMARCWKLWGRGELPLFGEDEGVYCHVCASITVQDQKAITGLPAYLDATKYNKTHTLSQFMLGKETGTYFDGEKAPDAAGVVLPGDTPIGVLFVYAKGNEWYNDMINVVSGEPKFGVLGGAAAGYIVTGVITSPLGIANPVAVAARYAGAVVGADAGFLLALQNRVPNSFFAGVVARPITDGELEVLGCQYAPVDET